jgi:hypothetical protein
MNIRGGGRHKPDDIANMNAHIYAITEVELSEFAVQDFRQTMEQNHFNTTYGMTCSITKESEKLRGRRVALINDDRIDAHIPVASDDDGLADLRASGRWTEISIPIGNANTFISLLQCFTESQERQKEANASPETKGCWP